MTPKARLLTEQRRRSVLDLVDQDGQVVVQNVENKKDPKPRGTVTRGAPVPYFLRIHGGIGMHAGHLPG